MKSKVLSYRPEGKRRSACSVCGRLGVKETWAKDDFVHRDDGSVVSKAKIVGSDMACQLIHAGEGL